MDRAGDAGLGWAGLDWAGLGWDCRVQSVSTVVLTRFFFTADAAALLMSISCTLYLQKGA